MVKYASDHRITRIKIQIPRRSRVANYRKRDNYMKIIPESRKREAMDHIRQRLESGGNRDNITMQEYCSEIKKVMKEAVEKYGKLREK